MLYVALHTPTLHEPAKHHDNLCSSPSGTNYITYSSQLAYVHAFDKRDYIVRMQLIKGLSQGVEGRMYSHNITGRKIARTLVDTGDYGKRV